MAIAFIVLLPVVLLFYTLYATRLSDSRFTNNFFERKLKLAATTRNFNTMSRLVALSSGRSC